MGTISWEDDGELALEAMLLAEDMGDYANLQAHFDLNGDWVARSRNTDVRAGYEALVARAATAFEHERIHGAGSLLRMDHPVVLEWLRKGLIAPSGR